MNPVILHSFHQELEKIAVTQEMRLMAGLANKLGLKRLSRRMDAAAPDMPARITRALTEDITGGSIPYIIPKRVQKSAISPFVREPVAFSIAAAPFTNPHGPIAYLGLREGAGRALNVRGAGRPGFNIIPEFMRNPTSPKNPFTHLQKRYPKATKRLRESETLRYYTSPEGPKVTPEGRAIAKARLAKLSKTK